MIATMVDEYRGRLALAIKLATGVDAATDMNGAAHVLAEAVGISYTAAKKVLSGETNALTAANNSKAAKKFGFQSDWLATGEGDNRSPPLSLTDEERDVVLALRLQRRGKAGGAEHSQEDQWKNEGKRVETEGNAKESRPAAKKRAK